MRYRLTNWPVSPALFALHAIVLLFLQCGWANASDAIEIMCVSFTIDSLKDSLNIEPAEGTWLSVVLFLGKFVIFFASL